MLPTFITKTKISFDITHLIISQIGLLHRTPACFHKNGENFHKWNFIKQFPAQRAVDIFSMFHPKLIADKSPPAVEFEQYSDFIPGTTGTNADEVFCTMVFLYRSDQEGVKPMKFSHTIIVRSPALLPMLYKPSELAQELLIPQSTLYDWLKAGAPHQRSQNTNHILIDGSAFAGWVEKNRQKKAAPQKLHENEAYCLRCKKAVDLVNPKIIPAKGRLYYIKGCCPTCANTIVRGGSKNDRPL